MEFKEEVRQVFIELALMTGDKEWFMELTQHPDQTADTKKERDKAATLFVLSYLEKQLRHHYNLYTATKHSKLKRRHFRNMENIKRSFVEECLRSMRDNYESKKVI